MVPEGWQILKLSDLSQTKIGNGAFNDPKRVGNGYKLINVVNLYTPRRIAPNNLKRLDLSEKEFRSFKVEKGDVFFTRSSLKVEGIAHCNIFDSEDEDVVYECHIMRVRPKRELVDPKFLHEFCVSHQARKYFMSHAKTGTMTTIDQKGVGGLPVPLPPLPEQKKIARILSTWDRAIETVERLIANSKAQKKALMQQLLTGKRRFPGFEGEWQEVKLGTLCEVRRGASPRPIKDPKWFSDEGRGWVRIADVTASPSRYLEKTTQYLSQEGTEKSVAVDPGDLIMSICATIGVPKILGIPACIHDGFVVFRGWHGKLHLEFLFHFLGHVSSMLANSGQPGTQKNLNTTIVSNIRVPKISQEEQKKIADTLTKCEEDTLNLMDQHRLLHSQKKALMQQLLTGKMRVKVDQEVA